jgi:lysophospholipase L1-like esterase
MSVQVSYKKQFLFGLILLLMMLSVIEISMKIYDHYVPNCRFSESDVYSEKSFAEKRDICNDNSKLVWNNEPYYLIPNQHFTTININSDGFRGNEIQENSDYRIFLIGGSTTFGVGATSDYSTIPGYLQQFYDEQFPDKKIEVINAGIPGAYSYSEKYLIENTLLNYNPDLLVIYDGWNDVLRTYEHYYSSGDVGFTAQLIREIYRTDITTPKVLVKSYFSYKDNIVETFPFNSKMMDEKVSLWVKSWKSICELQEKHDFKTILILQPILGTGNKILSVEEQKNFAHYDIENRNQNYEKFADVLDELNSTCITSFDLRNGFDSHSETIYFDGGHVGDSGNKIIADKIYEKILPTVLEDLSK